MTPAERNRLRSFPFLLRGLIPLTLLTVLIVVLVWPSNPGNGGVHEIDPAPVIAQAKSVAPYPVLAPATAGPNALPGGWRATSAKIDQPAGGPLSLRVGYVTPSGKYAQFLQSNDSAPAVIALAGPSSPDGTVDINGQTWDRATVRSNDEILLTRTQGGATIAVTGSADLDELRTLAVSLS